MRGLDELINVADPAWPGLREAFTAAAAPVEVLPVDPDEGHRCLLQMQVTARSALGALALHCGGLIVDDGWLRVFGGGTGSGSGTEAGTGTGLGDGGLPSLAAVNGFPARPDPAWHPAHGLVVGQDVLGGVFALNSHDPGAVGRPGEPGEMTYFAPDTLCWESLGAGHTAWVHWLLSGSLEKFYEELRWPGWREETAALPACDGIGVYPFLWSQEARADLAATSRGAVPMRELLGMAADSARQLGEADPGFLGAL